MSFSCLGFRLTGPGLICDGTFSPLRVTCAVQKNLLVAPESFFAQNSIETLSPTCAVIWLLLGISAPPERTARTLHVKSICLPPPSRSVMPLASRRVTVERPGLTVNGREMPVLRLRQRVLRPRAAFGRREAASLGGDRAALDAVRGRHLDLHLAV